MESSAYFGIQFSPLVLVVAALSVILFIKSRFDAPANIPPCPAWPLPIVGHLPYLAKKPRSKIMEWSKKQGEIFSVYFGSTHVVVLSSYNILKDTLVKQANVFTDKPKTSMFPAFIPEVAGIVETSGSMWKENRTSVLSILREFGMGKNLMADKVNEEVVAYLTEIEKIKGRAVNCKDITNRAVSNIICNFLLGKRFEYDDKYYARYLKVYSEASSFAVASAIQRWFPWLKYIPGDIGSVKKLAKNDATLLQFGKDFIRKVENDETCGINRENILAHYLKELREKKESGRPTNMGEFQLLRVITDLLVAGSETVTSTLLWFNLYMIHHPDVQRKVHDEIDREIGTSRSPTISDKAKLTYVNAVTMEIQRITSIVPLGLFHLCTEQTTLRGYTIPKDTIVMPHLDSALLDTKLWGDPHTFRPERFVDEQGKLKNPEHFVPFSMGRRYCIGEGLAKAQLFLFITSVYQRYKVVPEDVNNLPSFDSVDGITSRPVPYKCVFVERNV